MNFLGRQGLHILIRDASKVDHKHLAEDEHMWIYNKLMHSQRFTLNNSSWRCILLDLPKAVKLWYRKMSSCLENHKQLCSQAGLSWLYGGGMRAHIPGLGCWAAVSVWQPGKGDYCMPAELQEAEMFVSRLPAKAWCPGSKWSRDHTTL